MARAIPVPMTDRITVIGSAFGAGVVEAAAYRMNPMLGTVFTFGGAMVGLVGAMLMGPRLAQVAEGVASSSAGSLGHFAIRSAWPARRALAGNGRRPLGGNPRSLVGAGKNNPGNPVGAEMVNDELLV